MREREEVKVFLPPLLFQPLLRLLSLLDQSAVLHYELPLLLLLRTRQQLLFLHHLLPPLLHLLHVRRELSQAFLLLTLHLFYHLRL